MPLPSNPISGPIAGGTVADMSQDNVGNGYIITEDGVLFLPLPIIQALHTIQQKSPRIVAVGSHIAHLGRLGPVTLYNAPADGLYRLSLYISSGGIGPAASTADIISGWFDLNGEQFPNAVSGFPLDAAGSTASVTLAYLAESTDISYDVEITGGDGSERYDLFATLEKLF